MDIFGILTMIGGLALFLFGMDFMGANLSKASGGKLEYILEKLTSNPLKAVALGAGVTAIIQSSSATTVMVVGFVNSGIMKLSQATGIIMGANIGTTITSWMLSLTGIQGDSIWLKMLKPSSFAPVLALIGIIMYMFMKSEKKKYIGGILIGFAILMSGMETMSGAVKPLADVPEFTGILTMFSNPILGMLAGAVLTGIIQSSSASVGILQALCATGAVSYGTAIPIIMGQNIGTCVTALISSIGASKNAKRAACIHLYFNIIGTVLFMVVFYSINAFVPFVFLGDAASPAGIAVVHSCFNIAATCLLLPFTKQLEWLACHTVRDKKEKQSTAENRLRLLDARFLEQPALAMEHSNQVMSEMTRLTTNSLDVAMQLLKHYDSEDEQLVEAMENRVDLYEDQLGRYLLEVSSRELTAADSLDLSTLLHCIGDMERISDHAVSIARSAKEMHEKQLSFSEHAKQEMDVLCAAVSELLHHTADMLETRDTKAATRIEPLEEVVDDLSDQMKLHHVERLRSGRCTIEMGFILNDLTNSLERIADHCSNVGVSILEQQDDSVGRHEMLREMKDGSDTGFTEIYREYKEKYRLS
ncbi:MAG: Na/Pi cotransporter family protein [Lachnospiraceae bacterium]